jgi:hypothetical protein
VRAARRGTVAVTGDQSLDRLGSEPRTPRWGRPNGDTGGAFGLRRPFGRLHADRTCPVASRACGSVRGGGRERRSPRPAPSLCGSNVNPRERRPNSPPVACWGFPLDWRATRFLVQRDPSFEPPQRPERRRSACPANATRRNRLRRSDGRPNPVRRSLSWPARPAFAREHRPPLEKEVRCTGYARDP